jgi:hypothetical protein
VRWADERESVLYPGADVRIHPPGGKDTPRPTTRTRQP